MALTNLFGPRVITKERVASIRALKGAHRISFAYTHKSQPKQSDYPYIGTFSIPFHETIEQIFKEDTKLELFPSSGSSGVWRSIKSDAEFKLISDWVRRQNTRHFLRDCLDLSVALDQNLVDNKSGEYTELGRWESSAKGSQDAAAIENLVLRYVSAIKDLPFYRDAKSIAAVPPRPGKEFDLPSRLAEKIASTLGVSDLTSRFSFSGMKESIKSLSIDEKWAAWEAAGLTFSPKLEDKPSIILIDDKYQSGITLQFVASRPSWVVSPRVV